MKTNIAVGKVDGETHPRLDWIYLDGSYNAHMTVLSLHKHVTSGHSMKTNFLANSTNDRLSESTITWSWIHRNKS